MKNENLKYSLRSQRQLMGVHPELAFFAYAVINEMNNRKTKNLSYSDVTIFAGLRTLKKQREYIKKGYSKLLYSYHLYGLAIDMLPYIKGHGFTWDDKKYHKEWGILLKVSKIIIKRHDLKIDNGFDLWSWDKPHFQLTNYKTKFDTIIKK